MLFNYLRTALRNSLRNKSYTLINLSGLAVGLSVFLLLFLYIRHELSFNMYHSKNDRIYRIVETADASGTGESKTTGTNWAMTAALKDEFPEVENITRVLQLGGSILSVEEKRFLERNYYVVERSYFDVFDHNFLKGRIGSEVESPVADIVISESTSAKYFEDEDPVNKIIRDGRFGDCRVVAVFQDYPLTSSFRPDFLYLTDINRWPAERQRMFSSWDYRNCGAYVVLSEKADVNSLLSKKEHFLKDRLDEKWRMRNFELQAMSDFHLRSTDINTISQTAKGNAQYLTIFGLVALFVLAVAVINYINLTTARVIFRRKEVGMRKTVGATRLQLITQFLVESVFISAIATVLALGIVQLMLPWLNTLTERNISASYLQQLPVMLFIVGVTLFSGLVSGIIPAFIISAFQPGQVLQGFRFQKAGNLLTRKVLVVFQFSLSTVLIIATLVVNRQMTYVRQFDQGFEKERKLVIDINDESIRNNFESVKNELAAHADVLNVSAVSSVPGDWKYVSPVEARKFHGDAPVTMNFMGFDGDALATLGIKLKLGSGFTGNLATDSGGVLINEKAALLLGGESIIGNTINVAYDGDEFTFRVEGIVQNFNFESLYEDIKPLVIGSWKNGIAQLDYIVMHTRNSPSDVVDHATEVHKRFAPNGAIEYNFLDDQWNRYYKDDTNREAIFTASATLAIFIACLGLFGLASFATSLRVKEFGIRKVLGASRQHLVFLISREFIVLVLIGFAVATPTAFWLMNKWLSTFAYNSGISIALFLLAGMSILVLALLIVGFRSLNAARQNPIVSLRNE